jgi:ABC-type multidrug transport system fused ATPase/permease subunit
VLQVASGAIFDLIDTKSKVDPFKGEGTKPAACTGRIEFRDVCFSYPSRPDVLTLKVRAAAPGALSVWV